MPDVESTGNQTSEEVGDDTPNETDAAVVNPKRRGGVMLNVAKSIMNDIIYKAHGSHDKEAYVSIVVSLPLWAVALVSFALLLAGFTLGMAMSGHMMGRQYPTWEPGQAPPRTLISVPGHPLGWLQRYSSLACYVVRHRPIEEKALNAWRCGRCGLGMAES